MTVPFEGLAFSPADILLPQGCDYQKWAVVAYDQYTSQPEYWQRVEECVGAAPSALRLVLPESCLDGPNAETDIIEVNNTMSRYLRENRFRTLEHSMIYVERTLGSGAVRRGLMGKLDLEQYDYENGSGAVARASEETVLSCIPPRMALRKNAPLELPHAVLLADDREDLLFGYLSAHRDEMAPVYDFELMEGGGHLAGWKLGEPHLAQVEAILRCLSDPDVVRRRYASESLGFAFVVGDGNHALVTAKECYERQKRLAPRSEWDELPARYTLVELTNLHDPGLELLPLHRVLRGVEPREVLAALTDRFPRAYYGRGEGHCLSYVYADGDGVVTVPDPTAGLEAGTLQTFLDEYLLSRGGHVDYVEGAEEARCQGCRPGSLAFLMPPVCRERIFENILRDGVLPRKTFSLGRAEDKRFCLEARRIR